MSTHRIRAFTEDGIIKYALIPVQKDLKSRSRVCGDGRVVDGWDHNGLEVAPPCLVTVRRGKRTGREGTRNGLAHGPQVVAGGCHDEHGDRRVRSDVVGTHGTARCVVQHTGADVVLRGARPHARKCPTMPTPTDQSTLLNTPVV